MRFVRSLVLSCPLWLLASCAVPSVDLAPVEPLLNPNGRDLRPAPPDMGPTTAAVGPSCTPFSLTSDQTYDVALRSVVVRGTVTVDGQAKVSERGSILFVETDSHLHAAASLRREGDAADQYVTALTPGTYDVYYQRSDVLQCDTSQSAAFPCNGGLLQRGVVIKADRTLDLDVATVRVSGTVTMKGSPLADATDSRGTISFTAHDAPKGSKPVIVPLGATGSVSYTTRLVAGSYDVAFVGEDHPSASALACGGGVFARDHVLTADTTWNLDIPTVVTVGTVSAGGKMLTDRPQGHGRVSFRNDDGTSCNVDVATTGAATVLVTLVPGTYDIVYSGANDAGPLDQLPRLGGMLHHNVVLASDGRIDMDVAAVAIAGKVTVAGAAIADSDLGRGWMYFRNHESGETRGFSLGTTGIPAFTMSMVPGAYEVSYFGRSDACTLGQLPCGGGVVIPALSVVSSGTLDLDIPVITLSGHVTDNLYPLTSEQHDRGAILFHLADYYVPTRLELGTAGEVAYAIRVLPGHYDIEYVAGSDCDPASRMPCNSGSLGTGLGLSADTTLDLLVPTFRVLGSLTLNGLPFGDRTYDRGRIVLRTRADVKVASELNVPHNEVAVALGKSGPLAYPTRLIGTQYSIVYDSGVACDGVLVPDGTTPPCTGQVVVGCVGP